MNEKICCITSKEKTAKNEQEINESTFFELYTPIDLCEFVPACKKSVNSIH